MACVALPEVPTPSLPAPLSIAPTVPTASFDPNLCCKVLPFPIASPPFPLPAGTINPAAIAIVTQTMAQVQTFLNSLTITCPKE